MTDIEWADPPTPPKGPHSAPRINAIVEQLKARPGQWALVAPGMASSASGTTWKTRGCETVVRRNENGRFDVYARWPK